jgi:hypothetical protein
LSKYFRSSDFVTCAMNTEMWKRAIRKHVGSKNLKHVAYWE